MARGPPCSGSPESRQAVPGAPAIGAACQGRAVGAAAGQQGDSRLVGPDRDLGRASGHIWPQLRKIDVGPRLAGVGAGKKLAAIGRDEQPLGVVGCGTRSVNMLVN